MRPVFFVPVYSKAIEKMVEFRQRKHCFEEVWKDERNEKKSFPAWHLDIHNAFVGGENGCKGRKHQ